MKTTVAKSILLGVVMLAVMFSFSLDSQAIALNAAPMQITATYPDFSDLSQFTLNRDTLTSNPNQTGTLANGQRVLRLVPAKGYQSGSAFLTKRVSLANQRSFSTYFSFQITDSFAGGADGIVFTVQTLANNVGSYGGGIGYSGITPSVGVEFDTWLNTGTDPNDNHVGLDVNGSIASIATAVPPGQLDSGQIWHAWMDYDGPSKLLEVRMATDSTRPIQPILSKTIDLTKILNMDEVYVGFTSATGSAWGNHDIRSFYVYNDYGPIDTSVHTYTQGATQVSISASPKATYDQSTISAVVLDARNTPLAGQPVTFTTNLGTIIGTAVTDANGTATAMLSKTTQTMAGTATVKAIAPGGAYGQVNIEFLGTPNVAPAFTKGPDQMVNKQQVTSHTVTGWATNISAGPANESQQQLHFVVTNSDNSLFAAQPAISPDGTLTYTPALGANGVAVVTVRLQDDGGTANGRQDTSPEQTFNIVIDTVPPVTTVEMPPHSGGNEWFSSAVHLNWKSEDSLSGVSKTQIRINGGDWIDVTDQGYTFTTDGNYTVDYRSMDQAGNVEAVQTTTFHLDATAPVIKPIMPVSTGSNGWFTTNATVSFSGTDNLSGLASMQYSINGDPWQPYAVPLQFTADQSSIIRVIGTDQAGNTSEPVAAEVKVDKTPPSLKISVDKDTLWPPDHKIVPIHVTVEASDAMSGLQSVVLTSITSNEPSDGSGDGHTSNDIQGAEYGTNDTDFYLRAERSGNSDGRIYTVIYTATDKAGNVTVATATITVPHDQSQNKNK